MQLTRFPRAAVLAALFSAAALPAQQPTVPAPDSARADTARKLRTVTVTETRAAGAVGGASAVVVNTTKLRSSPAPLLEQALRESPFVLVRQNSRGEMELSIRGSDSRQAAVLLDGIPLTLGWDHRTDPSLVPITGADRILIVRGLSSLLNGPNTLGGTIEVSQDATAPLDDLRLQGGAGVDEHGSYVASLGATRVLEGVLGGRLTVRGGGAHRQRDGFAVPHAAPDPTAKDGLRTNSDLLETDGFASVRWSGNSGTALGLTISGFNAERGVPPEEHIASPRLWRYPYHSRIFAGVSSRMGSFRTPFGYGSLEAGAGYNTGRLKIQSFTDRTYDTVAEEELGDERTWSSRLLFTHSLPAGAELRAAGTNAVVNYHETLPATPVAEYQQRLWSGGAELSIPIGGATSLAGGLVYDRSATPRTGGRTPAQESFDNIGWRAGITRELGGDARLHASASQRSRFPALRELYSGALNRFLPNPDLKPETLLGFETGVTLDRSFGPIPDATVQLSAFHHDLDDAVVRITLPAPDRRFQRINRDQIRSRGVELLAGLALGASEQSAVTLAADALLQRITITDRTTAGAPTRHAENNPEARGTLELGVPLIARARGFANARYTGVQYCLNADTGSEMRLDATTISNFAVEKRFGTAARRATRGLRAIIALDNAANTAVYDQCGLPQPGRTLRLMLSIL
jgi:iron complex outermembrane recepter protein